MATTIDNICAGLDMLVEDTSVPRNIRRHSEEIKALLHDDSSPMDVRKAQAISTLDEMANDPNIPMHGRTVIWSVMSQLETLAA